MAEIDAESMMMQRGAGGDLTALEGDSAGVDRQSSKKKTRNSREAAAIKRRCVSTACIACRRRKSKCDGNAPSCAACSSVYGTGKLTDASIGLGDVDVLIADFDRMRLRSQQRPSKERRVQGEDR